MARRTGNSVLEELLEEPSGRSEGPRVVWGMESMHDRTTDEYELWHNPGQFLKPGHWWFQRKAGRRKRGPPRG